MTCQDARTKLGTRLVVAIVAGITACGYQAFAREAGLKSASAICRTGPLAEYVEKDDGVFRWQVKRSGTIAGVKYAELLLTSQAWRGTTWRHRLYVAFPAAAAPSSQALLLVGGGRWKEQYESLDDSIPLPGELSVFAPLVNSVGTPLALLLDVPHQPLFDGLREDAIIAKTFGDYFESKQAEDVALFPMVKSVVRAMDALQQYCRESDAHSEIERFTVAGASKRGWTTWLAAAHDERIAAIAPGVFDMLNMIDQCDHQKDVWGCFSDQFADYEKSGILGRLKSPTGEKLVSLVDPYAYREYLVQPKVIILGTNDPYWTLDALNQYWHGLRGQKAVVYIPNAGHGLDNDGRVVAAILALHRASQKGEALPQISATVDADKQTLRVRISADHPPDEVCVWCTSSPSLDFRAARWQAQPVDVTSELRQVVIGRDSGHHQALFAEATFGRGPAALRLSSTIHIVPLREQTQSPTSKTSSP